MILKVRLFKWCVQLLLLFLHTAGSFQQFNQPMRTSTSQLSSCLLIKSTALDFMSDLPVPSVVLELSELEASLEEHEPGFVSIDSWLESLIATTASDDCDVKFARVLSPGVLFLHCHIHSTVIRDRMDARFGSGKAKSIGTLNVGASLWPLFKGDTSAALPSNPHLSLATMSRSSKPWYLCLGLANHHVGGYYWGRSLGVMAASPAVGIGVSLAEAPMGGGVTRVDSPEGGPSTTLLPAGASPSPQKGHFVELQWERRRRFGPNSNDGKRSEWADFLRSLGALLSCFRHFKYFFVEGG